MRTLLHSVFDQHNAESVADQRDRIIDAVAHKLPKVATTRIRPAGSEKSDGEPTASASSPDRNALIRLVGAVLAEQYDEWVESRRYLGLDVLSESCAVHDTPTEQEATPTALTA